MNFREISNTSQGKSPFLKTMNSDFFKTQRISATKQNRIGISQMHKKQYPMNLNLFYSESPKTLKRQIKRHDKVPEFIHEYISDNSIPKYEAEPRIVTRNTFNNTFRSKLYSNDDHVRDLHPPVCLYIPPISYEDIRLSKSYDVPKTASKESKIYQPNTIQFSPRSKMVLYAHAPFYYVVPIDKVPTIRRNTLNNDYASLAKKQGADKKLESLKFSENLKKLKEIIKDPLIYEQ